MNRIYQIDSRVLASSAQYWRWLVVHAIITSISSISSSRLSTRSRFSSPSQFFFWRWHFYFGTLPVDFRRSTVYHYATTQSFEIWRHHIIPAGFFTSFFAGLHPLLLYPPDLPQRILHTVSYLFRVVDTDKNYSNCLNLIEEKKDKHFVMLVWFYQLIEWVKEFCIKLITKWKISRCPFNPLRQTTPNLEPTKKCHLVTLTQKMEPLMPAEMQIIFNTRVNLTRRNRKR